MIGRAVCRMEAGQEGSKVVCRGSERFGAMAVTRRRLRDASRTPVTGSGVGGVEARCLPLGRKKGGIASPKRVAIRHQHAPASCTAHIAAASERHRAGDHRVRVSLVRWPRNRHLLEATEAAVSLFSTERAATCLAGHFGFGPTSCVQWLGILPPSRASAAHQIVAGWPGAV